MRGRPLRKANKCQGVSIARWTSTSTSRPSKPARERVAQRQHHRREAQLEIDGRLQLALAADAQDFGRARRDWRPSASGSARRRRRAGATAPPHARPAASRDRRSRPRPPAPRRASRTPSRRRICPRPLGARVCVEIEHARDRQAGLAVGREMRVGDDRAGADGDDRPRVRRGGPALRERGGIEGHGQLPQRPDAVCRWARRAPRT